MHPEARLTFTDFRYCADPQSTEPAVASLPREDGGRSLQLIRDSQPIAATTAIATSRALLDAVRHGEQPDTLRIFRTAPTVVFGPADERSPGLDAAVAAASRAGFASARRVEGGQPIATHEETLCIVLTVRAEDGRARIRERYASLASLLVETLRAFGLDARVGAVPGEFCWGDYSVNVAGRQKVAGLAQRIARDAVQVGAVLIVAEEERLRDVLVPVYRALALECDPITLGSVASLLKTRDSLLDAVVDQFVSTVRRSTPLEAAALPRAVRARARELEDDVRIERSSQPLAKSRTVP